MILNMKAILEMIIIRKFVFEDGGYFIGKFDNGNKGKGTYYYKNGILKFPKFF